MRLASLVPRSNFWLPKGHRQLAGGTKVQTWWGTSLCLLGACALHMLRLHQTSIDVCWLHLDLWPCAPCGNHCCTTAGPLPCWKNHTVPTCYYCWFWMHKMLAFDCKRPHFKQRSLSKPMILNFANRPAACRPLKCMLKIHLNHPTQSLQATNLIHL